MSVELQEASMERKIPSWGEIWAMFVARIVAVFVREGLSRHEKNTLVHVLGGADAARSVIAPDSVFRQVDVETFVWLVDQLGGPERVAEFKKGDKTLIIQGQTAKSRPPVPAPPTTIQIVVDRQALIPCQEHMELLRDEQNEVGGPSQYDLLKNVSGWVPESGKPPITAWGFRQSLKKSGHLAGSLSFHDAVEIQKHGVEVFERVFGKADKVWFVRKVVMREDGTFYAPCLSPRDGKLALTWEPMMTATLGPKVAVAILRTAKG